MNKELIEAIGRRENSNADSTSASTMEDVVLHSQVARVRPETTSLDGRPEAITSEDLVTNDNMLGQVRQVGAAAAENTSLSAASLVQRLKLMVLCGPGGPLASGSDLPPVEITKELVLNAAEAVRELFLTHREQIQLSCVELDEREALAYLIGDAAGIGLITADSARKAGDKAGKLVWVRKGAPPIEKDLADAKRAVQRRTSKLPAGTSIEKELAEGRAEVLRIAVQLPLEKRPVEHAGPTRVPRPPLQPEHSPQLVKWCAGHGWRPDMVGFFMSKRIDMRKRRERAWNPRGWRQVQEKARQLEAVAADDDLCTCGEGVPSILCRVSRCYSTSAGARCDERTEPALGCDCMGWEEEEDADSPAIIKERRLYRFQEYGELPWWIAPNPPTPSGGWPILGPPIPRTCCTSAG